MQPKFYADENVPAAVALSLQSRGIDIITVREAGLLGKNDNVQLAFALKEERVLITHDSDFLLLSKKQSHFGIIFFTQQTPIGKAAEEIESICLTFTVEELKNVVLFVPF